MFVNGVEAIVEYIIVLAWSKVSSGAVVSDVAFSYPPTNLTPINWLVLDENGLATEPIPTQCILPVIPVCSVNVPEGSSIDTFVCVSK